MKLTSKQILKIFEYGVDHGLLLAEEERIGYELSNAFQGAVFSRKRGMPNLSTPYRQVHSKKWFTAKQKAFNYFLKLYAKAVSKELRIKNEKLTFKYGELFNEELFNDV